MNIHSKNSKVFLKKLFAMISIFCSITLVGCTAGIMRPGDKPVNPGKAGFEGVINTVGSGLLKTSRFTVYAHVSPIFFQENGQGASIGIADLFFRTAVNQLLEGVFP